MKLTGISALAAIPAAAITLSLTGCGKNQPSPSPPAQNGCHAVGRLSTSNEAGDMITGASGPQVVYVCRNSVEQRYQ
jgi:predicted small lipoprotein YifL